MSAEYLKEWIRKAEEDYVVAIALVRRRKWPTPSVESRYPGEETTVEEAKAAVKAMKEVRRFVRGLLGKVE